MGKEEDKLGKVALFYVGGLQPHFAYLRRLFSLYWGDTDGHTHFSLATNLPYVAMLLRCPLPRLLSLVFIVCSLLSLHL